MSDLPRRLSVSADLTVDVEGETVHVRGDGQDVYVDVPRWRTARSLLRSPLGRPRSQRLGQAHAALEEAGLTAHVRVGGTTVAKLGAQAEPSAFSRLLRLGDADVRPAAAVRATVRRRPVWWALAGTAALAVLGAFLWRRRG